MKKKIGPKALSSFFKFKKLIYPKKLFKLSLEQYKNLYHILQKLNENKK